MLTYRPTYWLFISFFIKKYLRQKFSAKEIKILTKNAKEDYKKLLSKVKGVGDDNPMNKNIYGALVFMSFLTGNPQKLAEKDLEEMIDYMYSSPLMIKSMGKMNLNKPGNLEKMKKRLNKSAKWGEDHKEYDENWVFNFPKIHEDGIYYYFSKCPIATYFKENGLDKYTKYFCAMDHKGIGLVGGKLFREGTIAEGKDMCDFWIVPDKIDNPK